MLLSIFAFTQLHASFDQFKVSSADSSETIDHETWQTILDKYLVVNEGGVNLFNYEKVEQADKDLLRGYLNDMQNVSIEKYNPKTQKAYWINLYNALTIEVVLNAYPVSSIKQIDSPILKLGPWKKKRVTVSGEELSLDNIEHDILRKFHADPLIHYGVNCASIGCPNLQSQVFTQANIDDLLTKAAKEYVNHPRGVRISNGKLTVSSIYKWFKEDFGSSDENIIQHIMEYANPELKSQLVNIKKISNDEYDWSLNQP